MAGEGSSLLDSLEKILEDKLKAHTEETAKTVKVHTDRLRSELSSLFQASIDSQAAQTKAAILEEVGKKLSERDKKLETTLSQM